MALLAALYPNQAPDVAPRMLGSAVLSSGWALFAIWLLLVPQPRLPGPGPWSAALGLAVMVTAYALRAATLLADGQVTPAETASGPANAPLLLASQFALLLSLGGLAVMWNARVVQEVAQLATHDSLTGLLNRRGFNLHWPAWRATHGRAGRCCSTSTASSRSTTNWATRRATRYCSGWPSACTACCPRGR